MPYWSASWHAETVKQPLGYTRVTGENVPIGAIHTSGKLHFMVNKWLTEAVSNNAAWCDAIAMSLDLPTHWNESIWMSEYPMPRFYPNIVTLRSGDLIDELIDSIGPRLTPGWGIKDSFSELDLDNKKFVLAFAAHWYCRVPDQDVTGEINQNIRIDTVKDQSELNRWVTAWGDGSGIFKSSLLENSSIELLYVERDEKVVSGLAANLSGDSVGISNAYGPPNEILGCVTSLIKRYPTKGIVGYGSKAEIEALSKVGFQAIGDLRVWLRD